MITDKKVLRILARIKNDWVRENVESFPEDERGEMSDMDILKDEIDYVISRFEDPKGMTGADFAEAKKILKHTDNGKAMPLDINTFEPRYKQWQIDDAKDLVAEYKQLKYYQKQLQKG